MVIRGYVTFQQSPVDVLLVIICVVMYVIMTYYLEFGLELFADMPLHGIIALQLRYLRKK